MAEKPGTVDRRGTQETRELVGVMADITARKQAQESAEMPAAPRALPGQHEP